MKKRKGFTLIEILLTMSLIVMLMAIAVPLLDPTTDSAQVTTMKTDLTNIENMIVMKYSITENYEEVFNDDDYYDADEDGFADTALIDGTLLPLSQFNGVTLEAQDCDGDGNADDGFYIGVWTKVKTAEAKLMEFDSCTNGQQINTVNTSI